MKISRSLVLVLAATVALSVGPSGRAATAQPPTVCGCPDVFDLVNRLNMDEAAVSALEEEIPKIEAADKQAGKTSTMYDENAAGTSNYEIVKATLTEALSNVQMLGGQTSRGETDGKCDSSLEKSSTPCMDEIVLWHEDHVHVAACDSDRRAGKTTAVGFRAPLSTVAYVREEMAGYRSEIDRIREILRSLPESCRPGAWVGFISYVEDMKMETQRTMTPGRDLVSGAEGTTRSLSRTARILYRETGTSKANVRIEENGSRYEAKTARWGCKGGLRQGPRETTSFKMQESTAIQGVGEQDVDASFGFDSETGAYDLSFQIPGLVASGTITRTDETQGDCDPSQDGTKTSEGAPFSQPYDATPVSVSGTLTRGLDTLRGEKTIELAPPVSMPGLTITHGATVRWVFYKGD